MEAKALICTEAQEFSLATVELAEPQATDIVVRCVCSGVSIGTEFALIRNKISWGPYPLCTGYQAVGVIEQVGDEVEGYAVGDQVYYRNQRGPLLWDGQEVTPVTGTHCSHAVVDASNKTHGPALLPEGVDPEVGSSFVMPAVGFYGVDMAGVKLNDLVAVQGVGLIGLGVVAAAKLRGARVLAIDIDPRKLEVAKKLGADWAVNSQECDPLEELAAIQPALADVVFEATGVPALLDSAFPLCRTLGKFVFQGNYGAAPIAFKFLVPHGKRVTAFFPCDDGHVPCRRAVLHLIASGGLDWGATFTHKVAAAEAPALYQHINEGGNASDVLGAVIRWS